MRKIGIPFRIFFILTLLALLCLLAPMIKAAQYDVPSEDDYPYGLSTHQAWERSGSLRDVLRASFSRVRRTWKSWQGSFSAIFLFTMNPMIYGEQYYRIGPLVILSMLILGTFSLTFALWGGLFQASKISCGVISVILTVICTQFLPRASQGIYWYNGAVYYTFFYGLGCLALSVLLRFLLRKKGKGIISLIFLSLMLFFIGGGNLVTGLTVAVLLVSVEFLLIIRKNPDWKALILPLLCFFTAFIINVSAPGNSVRQKYFSQPGMVQSVFISFEQIAVFFGKWFSLPVIALVLMLIPVFRQTAARSKFRFILPGLVSLYSVCLAGVMFYPPVYAMTERVLPQLTRITNIIFFGEVLLVVLNLFYWMGWLTQKGKLPERWFPAAARGRYSLIYLLFMLAVFTFGMTQIKWFDTTSISAFRSYRSGQMGAYWHTYKLRLEILKDPEVKDAVLKRFPYRPYVLFYRELSEDPKGNRTVAQWYGKDSVIIQ